MSGRGRGCGLSRTQIHFLVSTLRIIRGMILAWRFNDLKNVIRAVVFATAIFLCSLNSIKAEVVCFHEHWEIQWSWVAFIGAVPFPVLVTEIVPCVIEVAS